MNRPPSLNCRFCGATLTHTFVDLGSTPLANSYVCQEELEQPEPRYPLHARVCDQCFLVQVESVVLPEKIFSHYAYFSSWSTSWVAHASRFAEEIIKRFGLHHNSQVVEVASNDGYLLRHFVAAGIPVLGIEPAANVAAVADVPTEVTFFGEKTARDLRSRGFPADLLVGNNVLAHVPDLNDFVAGLAVLVKPTGVVSLEFPHLFTLMRETQFDTIYHEHFCYFSFLTVEHILAHHGLTVFDVQELPTHGGSLRIFAHRTDGAKRAISSEVGCVRQMEQSAGMDQLDAYLGFAQRVDHVKEALLNFLRSVQSEGRKIVAYGAAAKGNTLLNTCHIGQDLITYVVDRSSYKQGRYMPGSHLAIHPPERIFETKPDYVLILPWNLKNEIMESMTDIRHWGGRFAIPIPDLTVVA